MSTTVTPKSALASTTPAVGIFWCVGGALLIDRSVLAEAEPYGDFLTHAHGHYERWEEWQALGGPGLVAKGYPVVIASTEYEEWPRGRVVYETMQRRFILYADRRLQRPEVIILIKKAFGLEQVETVVLSDSHYR